MPRPITFTLVVIALVLLGLFWWWQKDGTEETAVFVNQSPEISPEALETESRADEVSVAQPERDEPQETEKGPVSSASEEKAAAEPEREGAAAPAITTRHISWGYASSSGRKIDTIVLHSSYNSLGGDEYSLERIIQIYKDYEVGAHYIIDRKGTIYRLVEDKNIAYHAGASKMPDGRTGVNEFSVGIELINNEDDQYTKAQYEAVNDLVAYLKDVYSIKHVVGHSDIAPGRKTDPWNFDWKKLK